MQGGSEARCTAAVDLSPEMPTEYLHQTLLVGIEHVRFGSTQTSHEIPELANAGQAVRCSKLRRVKTSIAVANEPKPPTDFV